MKVVSVRLVENLIQRILLNTIQPQQNSELLCGRIIASPSKVLTHIQVGLSATSFNQPHQLIVKTGQLLPLAMLKSIEVQCG
jgi:hypothetical protein